MLHKKNYSENFIQTRSRESLLLYKKSKFLLARNKIFIYGNSSLSEYKLIFYCDRGVEIKGKFLEVGVLNKKLEICKTLEQIHTFYHDVIKKRANT